MKLLDRVAIDVFGVGEADETTIEDLEKLLSDEILDARFRGYGSALTDVLGHHPVIQELNYRANPADPMFELPLREIISKAFRDGKLVVTSNRKDIAYIYRALWIKHYGLKPLLRHYWKTFCHKWDVFRNLAKFAGVLIWRGIIHDNSKVGWAEARYFALAKDARHLEYGSPEYERQTEIIRPGINAHYASNRHHPQYHENGIRDMSIIDKIEMICDWGAACRRNKNGNLLDSIAKNQQKYDYDNETLELFHNIAHAIGEIGKTHNPG